MSSNKTKAQQTKKGPNYGLFVTIGVGVSIVLGILVVLFIKLRKKNTQANKPQDTQKGGENRLVILKAVLKPMGDKSIAGIDVSGPLKQMVDKYGFIVIPPRDVLLNGDVDPWNGRLKYVDLEANMNGIPLHIPVPEQARFVLPEGVASETEINTIINKLPAV